MALLTPIPRSDILLRQDRSSAPPSISANNLLFNLLCMATSPMPIEPTLARSEGIARIQGVALRLGQNAARGLSRSPSST
jgi:hypothetical protein